VNGARIIPEPMENQESDEPNAGAQLDLYNPGQVYVGKKRFMA
jgi:hypothetical protein